MVRRGKSRTLSVPRMTLPPPEPQAWADFPVECLIYFVPMAAVHFFVWMLGFVVLAGVAIWQPDTLMVRAGRLGRFLALLLVVSALANGFWSCTVWGRFYVSTDYLWDFSPFWPITQAQLEQPFSTLRGRLLGVSMGQLQLVWLAFAGGAWALTAIVWWISYRLPWARYRAHLERVTFRDEAPGNAPLR